MANVQINRPKPIRLIPKALSVGILAVAFFALPSFVFAADVKNGEYVFHASGCGNCHTDPGKKGKDARPKGDPLAGGRPLKTPFGTFYTPNITPDKESGMGAWTFEDFRRAMVEGKAPNTAPYYPAFPYTSYTGMKEKDLQDLWAYMQTQPSHARKNQKHDLKFPFNMRGLMHGWRFLFFDAKSTGENDQSQSAEGNRGAYLVRVMAHCGECHTPRNVMGAIDWAQELAGNPIGPGGKIPDLTPRNKNGIVTWSADDIVEYLSSGMTPEGDFAGGEMAEVIDHSTAPLTTEDRKSIAVFLKALK